MNYDKWICNNCGHEGMVLKEEVVTNSFGVTATEVFLMCPECQHCFSTKETTDQTAKNFNVATRKKFGRVSYEDTLKLPRKYGISRELLNIVLELDAIDKPDNGNLVMFRSVWDDRIPTEAESERIRKALESPEYFLARLEAAKDKLPAERYGKIHSRVVRMK